MELGRCTAHSSSSLLSSSDVRRKPVHLRREDVDSDYGSRFHENRMYDRGVKNLPRQPTDGLYYRIETLVGIAGSKLAKYRTPWVEAIAAPLKIFWRPHLLGVLVFEVMPLFLTLIFYSRTTKSRAGRSARFWHWRLRTCTQHLTLSRT